MMIEDCMTSVITFVKLTGHAVAEKDNRWDFWSVGNGKDTLMRVTHNPRSGKVGAFYNDYDEIIFDKVSDLTVEESYPILMEWVGRL